jgi:hypothetical protein
MRKTSACWAALNLGFRPGTLPRSRAAAKPAWVRSRIMERSNSAFCGAPQKAEFERELISEWTKAGLAAARARGRKGGAPFKMTAAKVRLAMAAMGQPKTKVANLCRELGITRQTLYRHVSPKGALREDGRKLLRLERP